MPDQPVTTQRWLRYWDKHAHRYDREMTFWDRHLFRESRQWVCAQATGDVLEVAIGTGLNLAHYPADIRLTGIDFSPQMLSIARTRASDLEREVTLVEDDALDLNFLDASFDTVVCSYGLCVIPDEQRALAEMWRVLRPGGLLLLADHVASSNRLTRAGQKILELITIRTGGEHFRRRPLLTATEIGFQIEHSERFTLGIVERVAARKPAIRPTQAGG